MGGGRAAFSGMFHGTAGIGLALLRLHAALTGYPPYITTPDDPSRAVAEGLEVGHFECPIIWHNDLFHWSTNDDHLLWNLHMQSLENDQQKHLHIHVLKKLNCFDVNDVFSTIFHVLFHHLLHQFSSSSSLFPVLP